jgi:hypothetical protein
MRAARGAGPARAHWLNLASRAASDESLRGLLILLVALGREQEAPPVVVDWLLRQGTRDEAPKLMLKISWDGNEWRRLLATTETHSKLTGLLNDDPALASEGSRTLVELLETGLRNGEA